jgi:hypothetical protein
LLLSLDVPDSRVASVRRSPEQHSRTALVVLGSHRGGTSSLAGTLIRLGAAAPANLMKANGSNERGYYESTILWELNNDIQAAAGTTWTDWRAFRIDRLAQCELADLQRRARAALAQEFGAAPFAVVKDPNICKLLPFWRPVLCEAGWGVAPVLQVRSPLEVALSLQRRDGLALSRGCLLWLRLMLDAETETRTARRVVIDWRDLLGDWSKALGPIRELVKWPDWDESAAVEVSEFLSCKLRHHFVDRAVLQVHPTVSRLVREAYDALLRLVKDSTSATATRALDQIRAEFESAESVFDAAMTDCERECRRLAEMVAYLTDRRPAHVDLVKTGKQILSLLQRRLTSFAATWRELRVIQRSVFFDTGYYLKTYPDVLFAKMDPAVHYLLYGGAEGRNPSPIFSTREYLGHYPDVARVGLNALLHFETFGRREGRSITTSFGDTIQTSASPPF